LLVALWMIFVASSSRIVLVHGGCGVAVGQWVWWSDIANYSYLVRAVAIAPWHCFRYVVADMLIY